MTALAYTLVFRIDGGAEVAKTREFQTDAQAKAEARADLEQYTSNKPVIGSVSVGRNDGFDEPTWLGSWDFDPVSAYRWTDAAAEE